MSKEATVSIIIPSFNRKRYVTDAIDSCLSQTHGNCEIIVVDDGSTDGTGDHLRDRYGEQIAYIYQENQGPGIARNRGIAVAQGEFIHFLDADDHLHEGKIELGLDVFRRDPEVAVVYTHYQFVASDGQTPIETPPFEHFSDDIFCELLRQTGCHILISSSMYRRSALNAIGGFADDLEFRSAEDWDLFLRLAARYKFHGIDQRLVYRRMHDNMMSDDRYYGVLGRLKTVQRARGYGWERCMTAAEYDQKESARHHVLAIYLWRQGDRRGARQQFLRAAEIYPPEARPRKLFAFYTRFLPAQSIDWTIGVLRCIRKLVGRGRGSVDATDA